MVLTCGASAGERQKQEPPPDEPFEHEPHESHELDESELLLHEVQL